MSTLNPGLTLEVEQKKMGQTRQNMIPDWGIDFGMPALLEMATPEACAQLCQELGLRFVELNMNLPQFQTGQMDALRYRRIADDYGLFFTLHLDENLDVCNFNPRVAQAWRDTVMDAIDLAGELNIPVLNMHLPTGVYFTLPESKMYQYAQHEEHYLRSMREFRDLVSGAIGSGTSICVENTGGFAAFQVKALDELMKCSHFGLTLDAGHDEGAGGKDMPVILQRVSRLRHMHLHDARRHTSGTRQDHLPLGHGDVDVMSCLRLAKENRCRVVLETKTVAGLRKSVEWLRKNA